MGENSSHIREKVLLIKDHTDSTIIQYEDEREGSATFHINTFSRVLSEPSSQGINFEEKVKALALFLSLLASWEVFCTTFTNSYPDLNLDEAIR